MKKTFLFSTILAIILGSNTISAQEEDDLPYLSDDDIASIEIVLPEDTPGNVMENITEVVSEEEQSTKANEMLRLNASQSLYHLLILDRTYCSFNSDISDASSMEVLYKFKHGTNGYLIAIYKSSKEGPVFPQLPDKSRVIVDLITARKTTIKEYINSSAFRSFVTSRRITSQIQRVLETNL